MSRSMLWSPLTRPLEGTDAMLPDPAARTATTQSATQPTPRLWQLALQRLAENVDEAFAQIAVATTKSGKQVSVMSHTERMAALEQVARFYQEMSLARLDYFGTPDAIRPESRVVRSFKREQQVGEVIDLCWHSTFQPLWPDSVRRKYLAQTHNARAHARWIRHGDRPRPTVVLLHGYMGGNMLIEERMWPIGRWFDLGLDLVLSCLPFHGQRGDPGRGWSPPRFPSGDPRFTVEGFRQLIFDHQALFSYLIDGRASAVGMMGMSLGGYSTALLATLDPRLAFAVPVIPLASIAGFAHARGRLVGAPEEQHVMREALESVYHSIDPLSRPSLLAAEQALVIAGRRDRVTPLHHAERIASHLGAPLVVFEGGHLVQTGRSRAFEQATQMFERLGFRQR